MSYVQYNIASNASAYVDQDNPNTNYHTGELLYTAVYPGNTRKKLAFIKFPNMPDATGKIIGLSPTKKNGEMGISIFYAGSLAANYAYGFYGFCHDEWDKNTLTYNNKPNYTKFTNNPAAYIPITADVYDKIRLYGMVIGLESASFQTARHEDTYKSANSITQAPSVTFTLFDSIPIVTPIAPLRRFIDAQTDITFEWEYSNEYADGQKSYVIEISTDGTSWTELSAETTGETSVVIPAGTLASTVKYWRVKVVSEYDQESAWSAAIQIVVISPSVCILDSVTASPRPEARWFCEGQQAYQARFGDYETKPFYGTVKTYKSPIYLPDGEHVVSVRTQGTNGLWSQWSSQTITVANAPGDAITLTIFPTHRAKLAWSGGEGGVFYVLRDGKPIAKAEDTTYTDQFVIGKHTYQVLEQLAGGNYTLSNEVTATMVTPTPIIAPVSTAAWQEVQYSRESHPTFGESMSKTVALVHYEGRELPVAEMSGFKDRQLTFTVAFKTQLAAAEFETLLGQVVCYKTKIGRMIIGILSGFTVDTDRWFSQYSCTITATDYQEEIAYE